MVCDRLSLPIFTWRERLSSLLWALAIALLLALSSPYTLDSRSEESARTFGPILFNIPAQPLDSALQAYSRASGVDILYESGTAVQLMSSAVVGTFSRQSALEVLLQGTELKVRYTRSDAITISQPHYEANLPPLNPLTDADLTLDTLRVAAGEPADAAQMREFSLSTQADIEAALRKNARTSTGSYKASIRLWIDPQRTVRRAELAQSSGEAGRDASIVETLHGLVLRREPPANAPQPVRVVIVVRSL